jgi:hypothetical protein
MDCLRTKPTQHELKDSSSRIIPKKNHHWPGKFQFGGCLSSGQESVRQEFQKESSSTVTLWRYDPGSGCAIIRIIWKNKGDGQREIQRELRQLLDSSQRHVGFPEDLGAAEQVVHFLWGISQSTPGRKAVLESGFGLDVCLRMGGRRGSGSRISSCGFMAIFEVFILADGCLIIRFLIYAQAIIWNQIIPATPDMKSAKLADF